MVASYFMPIWWVSLTAPNYPKEAFPDGIRIHFHFNGVFNGCKAPPQKKGSHASEVLQADLGDDITERTGGAAQGNVEVGLNCVDEMNTINHYVGMYPIVTGSPVELRLSKFIFGFLAVMLLGFMATQRKQQLMILGAGFVAVSAWMVGDQIVMGNLDKFAVVYHDAAATFFNQPEVLSRWVANLKFATHAAIGGLIVSMVIVMLGVWKIRRFSLLLALVPALLPVFFVLDYAGWLWFFGHNMHPWGAFTVKPFMPTVFGEGKVAQFSTYSYPYYGYAVLLAVSAALLPALLIRRKQMKENQAS
ncbi:MAG: hypothetical protein CO125_10845 [Hydrogenophilales bacterium CG_4_9_14_3_um_filter_59_35]|nr:MAG: hypothetical protein COW70_01765 [Hydrogenophilales bacterium CG18_big_fil_WC_8_21_14_2_50_58_12]PIY01041.1 MAG: hypothetical protein COZ23_05305 [Hydrogenophilales bacterium CG_4_10_14_3_um_filter_58_23]PJB04762.1 MAG: hypothetical protein CO125_10845 [Hydrogenophilales bacterium CG_4_9_14_3_um_filter_59_35]